MKGDLVIKLSQSKYLYTNFNRILAMRKKGVTLLIVLVILAILDAAYLTEIHYSTGTTFCDTIPGSDCGTVNRGAYSEFPPWTFEWWIDAGLPSVPNALMALIALSVMLVLAIVSIRTKDKKLERKLHNWIYALLIVSFLYGLWLVYVQKFILKTWCYFCLLLDLLIISSLIAIIYIRKKSGD